MPANPKFQGQPCSAIEAAWPQNETIAQGILQHLNLRDVWNLRKTNSNMNSLLQGHHRPLNPNTTLSFIAARCDESRKVQLPCPPLPFTRPLALSWPASHVRCTNGPQQDVLMKYCEVSSEHGNDQGGPFNVCQDCINHNNQTRDYKENKSILHHWSSVCETCQDEEQNTFPGGCNTCVCKAQIRGEWKCDRCCRRAMNDIDMRRFGVAMFLRFLYRDRHGNTKLSHRRQKKAQGCWCGRDLFGTQAIQKEVRWCLSCDGVIVAPSNKPNKKGKVITRRSERIAKRRAAAEQAKRKKLVVEFFSVTRVSSCFVF